jgi:hypothetical protein
LQALVVQTKKPLFLRELLLGLARFALANGNLTAVQRWALSCPSRHYFSGLTDKAVTIPIEPGETLFRLQQEQELLLYTRFLLIQGKSQGALDLLASWLPEVREAGRTSSEMEILLLSARAYAINNNPSRETDTPPGPDDGAT